MQHDLATIHKQLSLGCICLQGKDSLCAEGPTTNVCSGMGLLKDTRTPKSAQASASKRGQKLIAPTGPRFIPSRGPRNRQWPSHVHRN